MQEALEALLESRRPLAARLSEAIELERACRGALEQAVQTREALEAERDERLRTRMAARAHAADRYASDELQGADVREAVLRFQGGFTESELAAELDCQIKDLKKFLEPMKLSGVVKDTGQKISGRRIFEYVKPELVPTPARERRPPPEVATDPAGSERMATGEPVRVRAVDRLTRQQRSGSANVHFHKMRDKRYEEMQAKREEAAQKAREKADRDMEKLRKMRKKK